MAKIGIKCLTYAKITSGGEGSAMVYDKGKMKDDFMAKADLTTNRSSTKEYGDDHQIDSENGVTGLDLALEVTNNDEDIKVDLLGETKGVSGELTVTDAEAPFVGAGFIMKNRFRGTSTYEAYWIYKIQFSNTTISATTRKEQTEFGHETLNGTAAAVRLAEDGQAVYYVHKDGIETEDEARTWLKTKANAQS